MKPAEASKLDKLVQRSDSVLGVSLDTRGGRETNAHQTTGYMIRLRRTISKGART